MTCFLQCSSGTLPPVFLVTFDGDSDELRIASSTPIAGLVSEIHIDGSGSFSTQINSGSFTVVDPTHIVIPNARFVVDVPPSKQVIHLIFYDADLNVIGTWDGEVDVDAGIDPLDYPLLTGITSPAPNQVAFQGLRFQSAAAGQADHGYVRLESYSTGCFEGPDTGFFLDGSPNGDWTVVSFTDTEIILENPRFSSCTPDDLAADFTVNGLSLDAPNYGSPPGDGYYFWEPWGSTYSAVIDGTP